MSEPMFAPLPAAQVAMDSWPAEIEHISASGLKLFAKCPEQYRRRYIKGERIPPDAALLWGRADHTAIEHNFEQKKATYTDLTIAEIKQVFAAEIDAAVDEAGGVSEVDWGKEVKGKGARAKARDDLLYRGEKLVGQYHQEVCPVVQPLEVEESFEVRLPGIPVPIVGRLDLVAEVAGNLTGGFDPNAVTKAVRIIDRKTSGKKVSKPESEWRVQAGIYMLHRWLPHEWHLSVKTKDPYVYRDEETLLLKPSPLLRRQIGMQLEYLVRQIGYSYITYGPDEPWDGAILHQWACSYCGFRPTCQWWKP